MRRQQLASRLLGAARALLGALGVLAASCGGYPDGLVVVNVGGLVSAITQLDVTLKLDDATATNTHPQTGLDATAFVVNDDMKRFGVQVPAGTGTLCLCIKGHNTSLVVVRSATATLNLTQGRELAVTLSEGTACDVATLACPAH